MMRDHGTPIRNLSWLLRHIRHIDYKYGNVDRNYK